jgi:hypothetical protein
VPPEKPTRVRMTPGAQPAIKILLLTENLYINIFVIISYDSYQTVPRETKIMTFQMMLLPLLTQFHQRYWVPSQ